MVNLVNSECNRVEHRDGILRLCCDVMLINLTGANVGI